MLGYMMYLPLHHAMSLDLQVLPFEAYAPEVPNAYS